jgi:hypothetical protein
MATFQLYATFAAALDCFHLRPMPGRFRMVRDRSGLHGQDTGNAADEFFSDTLENPVPISAKSDTQVI